MILLNDATVHIETSPSYRIPLLEQQTIPSYVRIFPSTCVPACLCLAFRCFRAGRSFPFGRAVGSNSIIDIPLLRCRRNFRRVSVLLPLTSRNLRLFFIGTWLDSISHDSNDVSEEIPAVEAYESKS